MGPPVEGGHSASDCYSGSNLTAHCLDAWLDIGPLAEVELDQIDCCEVALKWLPDSGVQRPSRYRTLLPPDEPYGQNSNWVLRHVASSPSPVVGRKVSIRRHSSESVESTDSGRNRNPGGADIAESPDNRYPRDRVPALGPEEVALERMSYINGDARVQKLTKRRSFTLGSSRMAQSRERSQTQESSMMRPPASAELLYRVVESLLCEHIAVISSAASDLSFLVSAVQPKGVFKTDFWTWSSNAAVANRNALGNMHELWEAVLVLIQRRDAEVTRIVCDVVGDLTFRHEKNALAFLKHHDMLDAVVDLIDNGEDYDTQVHGWRLLECCVEDVEEAKEIVCSSDRLLGFLREACTCSIENIRISSISVVMQCSSNDSARVNLIKAYIPERALKTVISSSEDSLATRILATLASAMLCGKEESSIISTQEDMLWQIVAVLRHSLLGTEYAGKRWPAASLILPLFNLSCSDSNVRTLIKRGAVPLLLQAVNVLSESLCERDYELTLKTLANFTFNDDAQDQMLQYGAVATLKHVQGRIGLKRVGTHQVLHHLIYLLMGGQNVQVQHVPAVPEDVARSHVMISYSTATGKTLVKMLSSMLKARGFDVWTYDEGSSLVGPEQGSSMARMSEAIEVAEYVIVFISRAYRDSYKCKLEGKYAQGRERAGLATIIYVMLEEAFCPDENNQVDGWLGMMIGESEWHKGWNPSFLPGVANKIDRTLRCGSMPCKLFENEDAKVEEEEQKPPSAPSSSGSKARSSRKLPPALDMSLEPYSANHHAEPDPTADSGPSYASPFSQTTGNDSSRDDASHFTFAAANPLLKPKVLGLSSSSSSRSLLSPPCTSNSLSDGARDKNFSELTLEQSHMWGGVPLEQQESTGSSVASVGGAAGAFDSMKSNHTVTSESTVTSQSTITPKMQHESEMDPQAISTNEEEEEEESVLIRHWKRGTESPVRTSFKVQTPPQVELKSPLLPMVTRSSSFELTPPSRTSSESASKSKKLREEKHTTGKGDDMGRRSNIRDGSIMDSTRDLRRSKSFIDDVGRERRSGASKTSHTAGAKGKGDGNDAVKERFRTHMAAWLLDNNLETLKDVLLYHAIDHPSLLCRLTTEQVEKLTDKIGLRLRLMKAIEKHKAAFPDWKHERTSSSRAVSPPNGRQTPTIHLSASQDKDICNFVTNTGTLESSLDVEQGSSVWMSSAVEGNAAEVSGPNLHPEERVQGLSRESSTGTEDVVLVGTGRLFAF